MSSIKMKNYIEIDCRFKSNNTWPFVEARTLIDRVDKIIRSSDSSDQDKEKTCNGHDEKYCKKSPKCG